jgi:hypothetical protein
MNTLSAAKGGFLYTFEWLRRGKVIDREVIHNLWPTEGVNHMLNAEFKGGPQATSWYVGLFEGNYTPTIADVASTFPALATECTTYAEATRVLWVPGTVAAGNLSNSASKAEFTSNANKTLYGGFLSSAAAKNSTSGVLGSIVRFSSPKSFEVDTVLRVTAGLTLVSA